MKAWEAGRVVASRTALSTVPVGVRATASNGHTVRRVTGGWRYEASSAPGLFPGWQMEDALPMTVIEKVEAPATEPPAPRVPDILAGRVRWSDKNFGPWVSFNGITEYRKWMANVRRELPGIKTEYIHVDWTHTAESVLSVVRRTGARSRGEDV